MKCPSCSKRLVLDYHPYGSHLELIDPSNLEQLDAVLFRLEQLYDDLKGAGVFDSWKVRLRISYIKDLQAAAQPVADAVED